MENPKHEGTHRNDLYNRTRFHGIMGDPNRSALQKYQDFVIGDRKLAHLIRFELISFFLSGIPGFIGLGLRHLFYPMLFKSTGDSVFFGRHTTLRSPKRISIGDQAVISDYAMLSVRGPSAGKIEIGNGVFIGRGANIRTHAGTIMIDDHANIGGDCWLASSSNMYIGKYCLFAARCTIGGVHHSFDRRDVPINRQPIDNKGGVCIESDVWLGAHVIVNDGVTIGTGSVIGAGSVVTKDIPPYSVAAGVPATVIRERKG